MSRRRWCRTCSSESAIAGANPEDGSAGDHPQHRRLGRADIEAIRRTVFDAGSLFRPYHSVNTDITSTTGAATAGTWKPATSSGTGVPGDPGRAVELYARACEGFAEACFPHIKTRDACLRLGRMYERGEGRPPDVKRALLIYREFCNQWGETPEACQGLDRLSSRGEREPPRR